MAQAKAISLHIGLNSVNPDQYEGWDGQLTACEFDAKDMLSIAKKQKFSQSTVLLTKDATAKAVMDVIGDAAKNLADGGLFVVSYSGHGGQVPDKNGEEDDGNDETWVLYDRMLIDDELYSLWSKFKASARIVVFSDSCHSGTVSRNSPPFVKGKPRTRLMPKRVNGIVYKAHKDDYDKIQRDVKSSESFRVKASVLLISGCQDNQLSSDGDCNGLFTEMLRKVWNNGKFAMGYRRFRDEIAARMPVSQTPKFSVVGKPNPEFVKQVPFTV